MLVFHIYDIIYDFDYDLNYDIIGQTFDIAVCRIVVVSPKLAYDIQHSAIVLIKNVICSGKKVKHHV